MFDDCFQFRLDPIFFISIELKSNSNLTNFSGIKTLVDFKEHLFQFANLIPCIGSTCFCEKGLNLSYGLNIAKDN